MKINILARPDHSLFLYKHLKKSDDLDVTLFVHDAVHQGDLIHKIKPNSKVVSKEVVVLHDLTLYKQILAFLNKCVSFNWRKFESKYSEISYRLSINKRRVPQIIHYWPVYCHKYVKKYKEKHEIHSIGDIYEAHPEYTYPIFEREYRKYNLDIANIQTKNDMDRKLEFLSHERNVVVASEFVKRTYAKYYPDVNIYVASYGFLGNSKAIEIYRESIKIKAITPIKNDRLRLVFLGRVSIEKGVHHLIETVSNMKDKNVSLEIVGPIVENQEKIFKKYSKIDNITFKGAIPANKVIEYMRNFDVQVLTSLSDNYSLSVTEGFQAGLPAIVSENTGNFVDIQKYNTGIVVPILDSELLTTAIIKMKDSKGRQEFVNNIERFIEDDSKNCYPDKIIKIYNEIINRK